MARCTAPVEGHHSASAAAACPACRGRYGRYSSYSTYGSYPSRSYSASGSSGGGFVTPASACWTLVDALAKGHEEDQLCGMSVPA